MNPLFRNILAIVAGAIIGGVVNMALITVGGNVMPAPAGVDVSSYESLQATMHLFGPANFVFPFLAHAAGTLVGAWIAASIATTHKFRYAMVIGIFFLAGGIANAIMLPAPVWFIVLDLVVAYLPMAWLGSKFALGRLAANSSESPT